MSPHPEPGERPAPPPPPPSLPARKPWHAEVTRIGWLAWQVHVLGGFALQYGPDGGPFTWYGSRERVERKAQRLVDRLNAPRAVERFTVHSRTSPYTAEQLADMDDD